MTQMIYVKIAKQRINDWGFKVLEYNENSMKITNAYGFYNVIETIKEILWHSNVDVEKYLLHKNDIIEVIY